MSHDFGDLPETQTPVTKDYRVLGGSTADTAIRSSRFAIRRKLSASGNPVPSAAPA